MARLSKLIPLLCVLGSLIWGTAPRAAAQTAAALQIQLYVGLVITGAVGTVYSIEYVTDLQQPNENEWRCLTFLQLPSTNYLWLDPITCNGAAVTIGQWWTRGRTWHSSARHLPHGQSNERSDRVDTEGPQMAVTISRGFWLGKYEVTQRISITDEHESELLCRRLRSAGRVVELVGGHELLRQAYRTRICGRTHSEELLVSAANRSGMGVCLPRVDFDAIQLWGRPELHESDQLRLVSGE